MLHYQTWVFTAHGKTSKSHNIIINLSYQDQNGIKNLNFLMDLALFQSFNTVLSILSKKYEILKI